MENLINEYNELWDRESLNADEVQQLFDLGMQIELDVEC